MKKSEITNVFSSTDALATSYLVADPFGIKHNPAKHAKQATLVELTHDKTRVTVQFDSGETKNVPINMVRSTWAAWEGKAEEAMKLRAEQDAKVQAEIQARKEEAAPVLEGLRAAGLEGIELNPSATSVTLSVEQMKAIHDALFAPVSE
jgi:hypothetical protein